MGTPSAFQPILPLSDSKLESFLQYVSSGTLNLSTVKQALSHPSGRINVIQTLIPLYTSKVPWGGLAYHYSSTAINSLHPEDVFEKIIHRGRGGHCLEMVPLFASVLLGLGYDLYLTGARISAAVVGDRDDRGFHGWSHLVLIVTIAGEKYAVDPQFHGILQPCRLNPENPDLVFEGIPGTFVRLRYCPLSEVVPNKASSSGLKTWLFEWSHSSEDETWTPAYIFSPETEWYLDDLPVMNTWLAKAQESYLVSQFQIRKLLLVDTSTTNVSGIAADGLLLVPEVSGSVELVHNHLKAWRRGTKIVDETIVTEKERIDILSKWFGIALTKEEADAIRARSSALQE